MKIINKIVEIVLNIIIVIISIAVIIALVYVVQTKLLKKENADILGYTAFEVATGSMSGTIEIGDMIIVKITDDVKENDIVVYKEYGNFITHRLIRIDEDSMITKGDANNSEDLPISRDDIFGKVIKIIPNVSIWKRVLTTPGVLISIIITIVLFELVISNLTSLKKEEE